ncbi:MAG: FAD binding domain-containing protein [Ferruginibacter sp.]
MLHFILNDKEIGTSLPYGMTLLDFIRYHKQLTGTKIGCREGDCGACTVLVGEIKDNKLTYTSATSCLMALGNAQGKHIVTIEGINVEGLNVVQQAFAAEGATQCGFCTPGFIVSLTGFCLSSKKPVYPAAIDAVNGNICRCTGYKSIERASATINEKMQARENEDSLTYAVGNNIIPPYFLGMKERVENIPPANSKENLLTKKLGGGTDLYVQQHEAMEHAVIDFLFDKKEFKGISQKGNECEIGASSTATDIAESVVFQKHFRDLEKLIKLVSSTQIRNMATIAGNFINASPIGDFTIFFLSLNAKLLLSCEAGKREIPLREFYKGYKLLNKKDEEIIEKIHFELPGEHDLFNFEKVCKRTNLDIASVNTAIYLKMKDGMIGEAGLAAGGVGPIPAFLKKSSEFLAGKKVSPTLIKELILIAQTEITPISDARGTDKYKRLLLSQLIKAHFMQLFPSLPLELLMNAS